MMQQQMPAQIPEGLAALLSLTSAMQQGRVAPTTPDGQPTVAAQAAQAAQQQMGMQPQGGPPQGMPPGPEMQDVAQGAGMAAQQQAQQQQEMMQQLPQMIAAMQQRDQAMDQGIASAPGAQNVNMAEGGIVGYSGEFGSLVDQEEALALDALRVEAARKNSGALDKQAEEDREAIKTTLNAAIKYGILPVGATIADLALVTPRAMGKIMNNTTLRALRAAGISVPNIPVGPLFPALGSYTDYLQNNQEAETLSAYKDASRQADVYRPPAAAPAQAPAPAAAQQQPDNYAAILKVLGAGGAGVRTGMNPQLAALLNASGPTPRLPVGPNYDLANAKLEENRKLIEELKGPATPEEAAKREAANREIQRRVLESRGIDPDQDVKNIAAAEALSKRRTSELESSIANLDARKDREGLTAFLLGASGRGLGDLMRTGAAASIRNTRDIEQQRQLLQKSLLEYQEASANKINALQAARRAEALGDFKTAMEQINAANAFENQKVQANAKINELQATALESRENKRVEREQTQYGQDLEAQSRLTGQKIQAFTDQQRMQLQADTERMRARVEVMLKQAQESDSRLAGIINNDGVVASIKTQIGELSKMPPGTQDLRILNDKYTELANRINAIRKAHNAPEIPLEPVIKYDENVKRVK